jgi:hypothetical protein
MLLDLPPKQDGLPKSVCKTAFHCENVLAERVIDYYKDRDPGRVYWLESASAFRDAFAEHNPAFRIDQRC